MEFEKDQKRLQEKEGDFGGSFSKEEVIKDSWAGVGWVDGPGVFQNNLESTSSLESKETPRPFKCDGLGLSNLFQEETEALTLRLFPKESGLGQASDVVGGAERKMLLEEARAGKKVQMWQGKGKWMGLANVSLRRPRGIVIGHKRKSDVQDAGVVFINEGHYQRQFPDAASNASDREVDFQPLASRVSKDKTKKKSFKPSRKPKVRALSAEAQENKFDGDFAEVEEAGFAMPPPPQWLLCSGIVEASPKPRQLDR